MTFNQLYLNQPAPSPVGRLFGKEREGGGGREMRGEVKVLAMGSLTTQLLRGYASEVGWCQTLWNRLQALLNNLR